MEFDPSNERQAADAALERAFFKLEAGIDLAMFALNDALRTANDAFGEAFALNKRLQRGEERVDTAE